MGALDIITDIVGIGLDIFGQHKEADAQAEAYQTNAARYQKEAEYQQYRTGIRLEELEEYKDQLIAKQRVSFAKAGVVIDRGTALRVVLNSAEKYEKDKRAILTEGGFNVERAQMGAASMLEGASQVKDASIINIGRTLFNWGDQLDWFSSWGK